MNGTAPAASEILVVGAGVAAHRFVEQLLRDPDAPVRVTVIGDEGSGPYDRSALVRVFSGVGAEEIQLERSVFRDDRVRLIRDDRVLRIDPSGHTVRTRARRTYAYDTLVLATGSFGAKVAVDGANLPGCFGFRTVEDVEAIRAFVGSRSRELGRPLRGTVVGAGLHGLQAAEALNELGVDTTVIEFSDRVMPRQLDRSASAVVQGVFRKRDIPVRTGVRTTRLDPDESGSVASLEFQDGSFQRADVVVFTVGVRARDELARNAGLGVHPEGGVLVDERGETSVPSILAIGEVARLEGRGPGYVGAVRVTADVAAAHVRGRDAHLPRDLEGGNVAVAGVDIATFGDPLASPASAVEIVTHDDPQAGIYRKLVVSDDGRTVVGGILVGDTSGYAALRALVGEAWRPAHAARLLSAVGGSDAVENCDHATLSAHDLLGTAAGASEATFTSIRDRFGFARGCRRCTLAIARVLLQIAVQRDLRHATAAPEAQREGHSRVLADGTHVVSPVMRDGTLTPKELLAIGELAERYGLRARITDARIELRGVRTEHLQSVRAGLAAAGLASASGAGEQAVLLVAEDLPRLDGPRVASDVQEKGLPHQGKPGKARAGEGSARRVPLRRVGSPAS